MAAGLWPSPLSGAGLASKLGEVAPGLGDLHNSTEQGPEICTSLWETCSSAEPLSLRRLIPDGGHWEPFFSYSSFERAGLQSP